MYVQSLYPWLKAQEVLQKGKADKDSAYRAKHFWFSPFMLHENNGSLGGWQVDLEGGLSKKLSSVMAEDDARITSWRSAP